MGKYKAIKDILRGIPFKTGDDLSGLTITRVTSDSRTVGQGDLFIAVRGAALDGTKFIQEACAKGAKAVVAEEDFEAPKGVVKIWVSDTRAAVAAIADNFYAHPSRKLKVAGVTGTNGKTTITYLIESIVKALGGEAGVIGTINYRLKGRILPAKNTTPGPLELQSMLAEIVDAKAGYAVMEVSSHSLDQRRVDRVEFDAAIFTNVTSDHLDYHKTPGAYFKAKARLFDKLKKSGAAILNIDDKKVASLQRSIKGHVITFGIKGAADVKAVDVRLLMDGTVFTVRTPKWSSEIRTKLIGMHNVSNILAAIAAGMALKIRKEAIIAGVEALKCVPGRLEAVDMGQPFKVFVDYAHTEDALFNILSLLRQVAAKRIVTVFGCGGNRDRTKRPLMGKVACRFSDHVIITSDNPRFEEPEEIIREIEHGVRGTFDNYDIVADRKSAIAKALKLASHEDIVVIAGKGHEDYQIIKDKVMPFDDREVAMKILHEGQGARGRGPGKK